MTHSKFKGLTLCSLAALFVAGQAFAHTGVRDQATEGTPSYNGFTIGHGCGAGTGTDEYPVLGQAALFPIGANAVWKNSDETLIQVGGNPNNMIGVKNTVTGNIDPAPSLSLGVTGYAGFSSPFATSQEIVDDSQSPSVVMALLWKDGAMEPKLGAITPFKITAPTIADNCVKSLKIRLGVINFCDVAKNAANDSKGPYNAPKDAFGRQIPFTTIYPSNQKNVANSTYYTTMIRGNGDNNRADWWFGVPHGGSALYNDPQLITGAWATLTVNNSAADIAKCAGTPVDVIVEPSGAAFDNFLSGTNTRPFTQGDTDL